ncbi:MAG: NADH-quinone oxidoreductase subunit L [Rhodospirillaceae bacterium]|jgi:NADH-quinone oxidoreductase subunit L|nr:NADH-quinone oxidoreductase subunit L [Rhodospirillaceae bacterium]MBT5943834.1 NADH-quinone oxidoreductase subunit L [Rhodospirillaceae bacterium]MBT6403212.1 NADH-quinone oxidoreductase subunit L [Rhodospirillaceae bacterium]MBT6536352.1 NADH-quinone oxidoreductase subunit L [Rhodospirillaceae bacterium]MBT7362929.1 NADH-quinone oxidoreductase subunit L [Rhodospirillaceae bacterium]
MIELAVFLPLIGGLIAGIFGVRMGDRAAQLVTVIPMLIAAVLSSYLLWHVGIQGNERTIELFTWIDSGTLEVSWALRVDTLTAVMMFVVNVVSSMVHVYSVGYMAHDPHKPRFMAYLSLFTFFMLALVTADNFVQMFFGWEGVGLMSYLLIGFWFGRPSANAAAIKAFVVNRVGDFGFMLGIFGVFFAFGTLDFDTVFAAVPDVAGRTFNFLSMELDIVTTLCFLLFIGAMGKSAQIGLHTWLPDAMEGPTPVSALIHAATMVTAGVFMVARLSPMFEFAPVALTFVAFIGASTAFFAATIGLTQFDIKRVIAYSTCSQLGYMFFAIGVGAYPAAIFHLMTHAFFKALLFLGAGSVIHGMDDEQDMRKMGGLYPKMRKTAALMWIGSLALAGVGIPLLGIGFAGFYSKDIILESAFAAHTGMGLYAFWAGIAAALMTAFYSWRLLFLTFHGRTRADEHTFDHAHESPMVMIAPLFVLAAGALFSGALAVEYFVGHGMEDFWGSSILMTHNIIEEAHHVPKWVKILPIAVGVVGIVGAWFMYMVKPDWPARVAGAMGPVYRFVFNKWYFDELYDRVFVRPSFVLGRGLWKSGDGAVIDGVGPDGIAAAARDIAARASRLQSGFVYHYAFAMLIGLVVLASWFLFGFFG